MILLLALLALSILCFYINQPWAKTGFLVVAVVVLLIALLVTFAPTVLPVFWT